MTKKYIVEFTSEYCGTDEKCIIECEPPQIDQEAVEWMEERAIETLDEDERIVDGEAQYYIFYEEWDGEEEVKLNISARRN